MATLGNNKVELLVEIIVGQVVSRLNKESANKTQKDIQTLAEAIQCLQKDFKSLKRKNSDTEAALPPKRQNIDQEPNQNQRPSTPRPASSIALSDPEECHPVIKLANEFYLIFSKIVKV